MNNYCIANFGPSVSFNASSSSYSCDGRGTCGQCRYAIYLSEYCVVVDVEPIKGGADPRYAYNQSTRYGSCFYPFGQNDQLFHTRHTPTSVNYTVRQSNDPFIALQRLTEGDMNFGATSEDKQNTGFVLIILGSILILCTLIGCFCVYCNMPRAKRYSEEA